MTLHRSSGGVTLSKSPNSSAATPPIALFEVISRANQSQRLLSSLCTNSTGHRASRKMRFASGPLFARLRESHSSAGITRRSAFKASAAHTISSWAFPTRKYISKFPCCARIQRHSCSNRSYASSTCFCMTSIVCRPRMNSSERGISQTYIRVNLLLNRFANFAANLTAFIESSLRSVATRICPNCRQGLAFRSRFVLSRANLAALSRVSIILLPPDVTMIALEHGRSLHRR